MKHIRLVTLLLLLLAITAKAQTHTLQYNLEKGKTYYFESVAKQVIDMGEGQNMDQEIITGIDITVNNITPAGIYECSIFYRKMQIVNSAWVAMGMQQFFDKSSDAIMGLGYDFTMNKAGKTLSVAKVENFINSYADSMMVQMDDLITRGDSEGKRDEFYTKLKAQFSDSTVSRDLDNITGGFMPSKPIKINEKWVRKSKTSIMFDKESTTTYTLTEVKDGFATITSSGKSSAGGKNDFASIEMKPDLDMKVTGTYKIDLATGLIVSGNSVITANGTMSTNGKKNKMKMVSNNSNTQFEVK